MKIIHGVSIKYTRPPAAPNKESQGKLLEPAGATGLKIIEKRLVEPVKQLKEYKNINIRVADKAAVYVTMKSSEYLKKINILSGHSKVARITQDSIEAIKRRIKELYF